MKTVNTNQPNADIRFFVHTVGATPSETIRKYISVRYEHWLDYSKYKCSKQNMEGQENDVLDDVLLNVLQKDEQQLIGLYTRKKVQKGVEYSELDFFILRMLDLNITSETSPYRHKNKSIPAARDVRIERLKIPDIEYFETDRPAEILKQTELIRKVFNRLRLTSFEYAVFEHRFFLHESLQEMEWHESIRLKSQIYNEVLGVVQTLLFFYGFTKIEPKNRLKDRQLELVEQFIFDNKIHISQTFKRKIKMEQKVIFQDHKWEVIKTRHEDLIGHIQQVVDNLLTNGLTVSIEDLRDLINHGKKLHNQIDDIVKSNAKIFSLPAARQKFIEENTVALQEVIAGAKRELYKILAIESSRPSSIDAYMIENNKVILSDQWVSEIQEAHTVRSTPSREKALELIANVEKAIEELNAFVAENRLFGSGITSSQDSRRSLMYISGKGSVHVNKETLEFI